MHLRGRNDSRQRGSGHGAVVHPHGSEGARPRRLRRPEPLQALDRPGGQELGRFALRPRRSSWTRTELAPYDASKVATAAGRAPRSTTRSRPRSRSARQRCPPATRRRSTAAAARSHTAAGPFPVTSPAEDGATLTCTITNKQTALDRASGEAVGRHAVVGDDLRRPRTACAPFDASTVATASGDSASFTYPVSTPVTVGEVAVPAGYEATIHCGTGGPQPYTGGPFPVTSPAADGATHHLHDHEHAGDLVRARGQEVGRRAVDRRRSSSTPTAWRRSTPPRSRPTTGASASFTYPLSTPVTVGETAVPGRLLGDDPLRRGARSPTRGGPFPVTSPAVGGATLTCVITNTQQLSTVRVGEALGGRAVERRRSSSTRTGRRRSTPQRSRPRAATAPRSPTRSRRAVTVGETAVPAGYAATIQCGGAAPQPYAGGPFPVTSPAVDGATHQLHDHEHPAALDRPRDQELVRNACRPRRSSWTQDGIAPFDASTVATADGDNASFTYPVSTAAFVGETAVPAGYTATIQCGNAAPQWRTRAVRSPVTSPATNGATLIMHDQQQPDPAAGDGASGQGVGRRARRPRRSSWTRTASPPSTPRRWRPPTGTTLRSTTSPGRR